MKQVLLVRHCESTGPAPDAPLTVAGREQARRLVEWLRPFDVDHVVSSPFARPHAPDDPRLIEAAPRA
jgi:2,3-bisphosphoglycerate-dependent phosphoglycerate mutase